MLGPIIKIYKRGEQIITDEGEDLGFINKDIHNFQGVEESRGQAYIVYKLYGLEGQDLNQYLCISKREQALFFQPDCEKMSALIEKTFYIITILALSIMLISK